MRNKKHLKEKNYLVNPKGYKHKMVLRLSDSRYSINSKLQIVAGSILFIAGIAVFISAMPRSESKIVNIWFLNLNMGPELDVIRFFMGIVVMYIGLKGIKLRCL